MGTLGHFHGCVHKAVLWHPGIRINQEDDLPTMMSGRTAASHSHSYVPVSPCSPAVFVQCFRKGRVVQVSLVNFAPGLHCGFGRWLGPLAHLIQDILNPEGERVAVIEITGFLETASALKPVHSIGRTGDVSHVVVAVVLDAACSVRLAQQLQAIIADDHVDDAALPLIHCGGSLDALESGDQDFLERFLR